MTTLLNFKSNWEGPGLLLFVWFLGLIMYILVLLPLWCMLCLIFRHKQRNIYSADCYCLREYFFLILEIVVVRGYRRGRRASASHHNHRNNCNSTVRYRSLTLSWAAPLWTLPNASMKISFPWGMFWVRASTLEITAKRPPTLKSQMTTWRSFTPKRVLQGLLLQGIWRRVLEEWKPYTTEGQNLTVQ